MSRLELYSPEGLRSDGRRYNELRNFECAINTHPTSADGSSYVQQGETKVMCLVSGPQEPESRARTNKDRATLTVGVNISPFASTERRKRQKNDRRLQELGLSLQRAFQEAVLDHLHPRTEIVVHLNVIAQDGGMVGACFNAMSLALIDAGIPMYNYVSGCGVAVYDTVPLLDPNQAEESDLSFLTAAVIGKSDKVASLLLENKLPMARLENALGLAIAGCHSIRDMMDREVRRHGKERALKTSLD